MSTTTEARAGEPVPGRPGSPTSPGPRSAKDLLRALVLRLHFYAGVFVGPFLLVAALSGALYAMTPTLEEAVYDRELHVPVTSTTLPLAEQVQAAQQVVGDDGTLAAVRPAPEPGDTTRVMFTDPSLGESESRAIFVDPATAEVRGDLTVYGTSGVLPLRMTIDQIHRSLLLGDAGRLYSELAASWLWVIALAGLALWLTRPRKKEAKRLAAGRNRVVRLHSLTGVSLLLGFLFLSATGLTWSQLAGNNVSELRAAVGQSTPSLSTALDGGPAAAGEHAGHGGAVGSSAGLDPAMFDHVLAAARQEPIISAGMVEIKPPAAEGMAWSVAEIDRGWPTQVDAVALDPASLAVTDRVVFADYPVAAKLARWGIDLHMGSFGLANQLVLTVVALGLAAMIVWGYVMWWKRRPTRGSAWTVGRPPARRFVSAAPKAAVAAVAAAAVGIGILVPLLGITLAAFLVVDLVLGALRRRRSTSG
jgi:uncharacterized iron-regulated membrane protein